jgi:hypothetical protein
VVPTVTAEEPPTLPSKSWNSRTLTEGRKEAICNTTKTVQGATYPANLSLRNTAGAVPKLQGYKQKQLQIHASQFRMKQQDICSPTKANSTKDLDTCIEEEPSNNEF